MVKNIQKAADLCDLVVVVWGKDAKDYPPALRMLATQIEELVSKGEKVPREVQINLLH